MPRNSARGEVWDVYQVKKFALNLSPDQKIQIEKSFRRLMVGLVRRAIPVGDWYLVMPLDPTPENVDWFANLPDVVIADIFAEDPKLPISAEEKEDPLTHAEYEQMKQWRGAPGRIIDWKGLNACEAWVSKYWYVTDYYLNGGRERLRNAVTEVAKILQRDQTLVDNGNDTALLTPAEVQGHLLRLQSVLDGDPHFRYGISLDPHVPEIVANEPRLVAASQTVAPDGSCLTFRIYTRFAEALSERPIPIRLEFSFDDPQFDQEAYNRWRKYGTPFSAPAIVEAGLPGGLDGPKDPGWVNIVPATDETYTLRVRVVADGAVICPEISFTMTTTVGPDGTGVWSRGADASGLLSTEGYFDAETGTSKLSFKMEPTSGAEIGQAWPAIALMASMVYPNMLQIAGQYGPFTDMQEATRQSVMDPTDLAYLRALAVIQSRTPTVIRIPHLGTLTMDEMHGVTRAASMIEGQLSVMTWSPFGLTSDIVAQLDPCGDYEFSLERVYELSIGSQKIALPNTVASRLLSAKLEDLGNGKMRLVPYLNYTCHEGMTGSSLPPEDKYRLLARRIDERREL